MAFVLVNFSWAFRADIKIPNVANWVTDEVHARIPGDPSRCSSFPSHPLHPPHRCPSWWCPGAPRPRWPTPWPPLPSAGSGWSRRFCCSRWSPARLAIGNPGTFSKAETARGQGQHLLPCFAAGVDLCPCAGGLGALRGEAGVPGRSQPWAHFASPGKRSGHRSISAGMAEVSLECLEEQITALWLQPCLCGPGHRVGWCLKRHHSNTRALLQLPLLRDVFILPLMSVISLQAAGCWSPTHRHDYTFPECSILNNPTYSIGIK